MLCHAEEGSFTSIKFHEFIRDLLVKMNDYDPNHLSPNSVIVLDNCTIHKAPEILDEIVQAYVEFSPSFTV